MRVLVCGSRDYDDDAIFSVLDGLDVQVTEGPGHYKLEIISGCAAGADSMAAQWADQMDAPCHEFPADWEKYGKAAGPIRNQRMLDAGKPDQVWAFTNKPLAYSVGTADMVRRAVDANIPTYVVQSMTKENL